MCGGVVGQTTGDGIIDCSSSAEVIGSGMCVGGVIGYIWNNSSATNCYNTGNVTGGEHSTGGVVGYIHDDSSAINCYNTGNITGTGEKNTGGVVGFIHDNSSLTNCYNTGKITGKNGTGGITGGAYNSSVENCYNTGEITGKDYTGGVVGSGSIITKCYNTGKVTGTSTGGIVGDCFTGIPQDISLCYNSGTVQGAGQVGGISGYLGAQGYAGKETKCYNKGNVICTTNSEEKGEIVGKMANDANVTNCYFYTNDDSRYGVGVINSGGSSIETQRAGTKRITNNFNSLDEFITWLGQQQN